MTGPGAAPSTPANTALALVRYARHRGYAADVIARGMVAVCIPGRVSCQQTGSCLWVIRDLAELRSILDDASWILT